MPSNDTEVINLGGAELRFAESGTIVSCGVSPIRNPAPIPSNFFSEELGRLSKRESADHINRLFPMPKPSVSRVSSGIPGT